MSFELEANDLPDHLLRSLMTRVRRIAFRMKQRLPAHIDVNDLISAGYLGLTQALANWQGGEQGAFEAYSVRRATGAMVDELRGNDQLTRGARRLAGELLDAENRLAHELGRRPEAEEIAHALGMSQATLIAARLRTKRYDRVSLTAMDGSLPQSLIAEEPELLLDRTQREKKLQAGMDQLPERLRNILHMCCDEGLTLREIGLRLGVTEARVCQLRKEAVARLRRHCQDTVFPPAASYEYAA